MRGWVCSLQLLLALASTVILRSDSRGTRDHILLSQIRDSPNLEGQVPYLNSPGTGWTSYTPRHWVPFSSPPTTRRAPHGSNLLTAFPFRSPVYSLGEERKENAVSNSSSIVQCFLSNNPSTIASASCYWNVFIESLPRNGRLLWLNYFGFQRTCHNILICYKKLCGL
jgi:hypothetical protein